MKKYLLTVMALILGIGLLQAGPVDAKRAKLVGQQFAQTTLLNKAGDLELVYAPVTERGTAAFYVFNIGQNGYVIVSGDDFYRPIIGYNNVDPFDPTNPGLAYYLRTIQSGRNVLTGEPTSQVKAEWEMVMNEGRLMSKNGGRMVDILCQTRWNQNYPYNYYCPSYTGPGNAGGHFYAGCVATAMAQVMKVWNHPLQGQGSHTYTSQAHPYTANHPANVPASTCTANFGATTYDWANMPNRINSSSPQVQIDAVATLIYHCAVSVDMDWDYDGSGSNSQLAAQSIANYFKYTNAAVYQRRANYSATVWAQKVKESLDMGWPMVYSGVEEGEPYGHAFVLDGYNDNDLYHFNFGWSGSGDDWLTFEGQDYHVNDGAIFNFVPVEVYNTTPQAPTAFTVTPTSDVALSATLTWTNPAKTLTNNNLSSIDYIVVKRGDEVIATLDNVTPGQTMTYVDNEVPRFDLFQYSIYAVCNGSHGKTTYSETVSFGPTCNWTIMMASNQAQGWRGGYISIYNSAGSLLRTCTTTASSPSSVSLSIPIGRVYFGWTAPSEVVPSMTIILKNSSNATVYSYTGSSADLAEGIFFETNNGCGNNPGSAIPMNLIAEVDDNNPTDIHVSWDPVAEEGYGYNIYRDGIHYRTIPQGTSFIDHNTPIGGHCYYATFLSYGGENEGRSNEYCATSGVGCEAPSGLWYELTGAQHKPKLTWTRPENTEGLSSFDLYRKKEGESDYSYFKSIDPSKSAYTDNSVNQVGVISYRLCAYYEDIDCLSAPASQLYHPDQFHLDVYWSPDAVEEGLAQQINLYPNPTKDRFTIEGEALQQVMVYNALGQLVYSSACFGNSTEINLGNVDNGFYMVKVITANGDIVKKVTVMRN